MHHTLTGQPPQLANSVSTKVVILCPSFNLRYEHISIEKPMLKPHHAYATSKERGYMKDVRGLVVIEPNDWQKHDLEQHDNGVEK